jgi:hypothetical protein
MENCLTVEEPEEESSSSSEAELSSSRSRAIASSAMPSDWVKPSICDVTLLAKSSIECSAGSVGGAIVGGFENSNAKLLCRPPGRSRAYVE